MQNGRAYNCLASGLSLIDLAIDNTHTHQSSSSFLPLLAFTENSFDLFSSFVFQIFWSVYNGARAHLVFVSKSVERASATFFFSFEVKTGA